MVQVQKFKDTFNPGDDLPCKIILVSTKESKKNCEVKNVPNIIEKYYACSHLPSSEGAPYYEICQQQQPLLCPS